MLRLRCIYPPLPTDTEWRFCAARRVAYLMVASNMLCHTSITDSSLTSSRKRCIRWEQASPVPERYQRVRGGSKLSTCKYVLSACQPLLTVPAAGEDRPPEGREAVRE